jgi:phosphoribosylformylglycinamidine (FGAM) synthase PurS component
MMTFKLLVRNTGSDGKGLLGILRDRLGLTDIKSIEKGVLWTLHLEGVSEDEGKGIAREIAEKLLSNRHFQEYSIVG